MMLHELPKEHIDRNTPLSGFFYKWKHSAIWLEIKPSFAIAKNTYNELGRAWTDHDFFAKDPSADNALAKFKKEYLPNLAEKERLANLIEKEN